MTNENITVTVAITTYNRLRSLLECLHSLSKQTNKDFEVVIVNGGDSTPVKELISNFKFPCKIVQEDRKGVVEARNLCWKESKSDIVCIIDDDLVVSENWIDEVVKTFSSDEQIGGVTGPTLVDKKRSSYRDAISLIKKFETGNFFWKIIGKFYLNFILEGKVKEVGCILDCGTFTLGSNFSDCLKKESLIEVDYLEGCHMCFRRKLVDEVGGFDYFYTGTGEWSEPDLAFKIKKLGYKLIFNPKAVTEHRLSEGGFLKSRTFAFERSVNFINFYFRHIKPNTFHKISKFYSYLLFINCYWIYKYVESKNINWLTGVAGTVYALTKKSILKCQNRV